MMSETMQKSYIYTEAEINRVAQQLITFMPKCHMFTFTGPLGAGKTTLIRTILQQCHITENVTSPTFTYVNIYQNDKGQLFYHFDLYRVSTLDDFLAAGFAEFLHVPDSWVFIEWPEVIMPLLKRDVCHCEIDYSNDKRKITITTSE